jgi:hypothetical protein
LSRSRLLGGLALLNSLRWLLVLFERLLLLLKPGALSFQPRPLRR